MEVLHYQRKPRSSGNYSLEFIFENVRKDLSGQLSIEQRIAPCLSSGLVRRLLITLDAWFRQRQVTHVTGDINFAVLAVRSRSSVLTVLDCGFLKRSAGLRRSILKALWLDWPVRHASYVTTISEAVKQEIVELTGCEPTKVVVVPVAISKLFLPEPKAFNSTCPRILLVGTAPNKNLQRVVAACAGIPCKLAIIGVLSEEVRACLNAHEVDFENYVGLTEPEVIEQYKLCDLVCFASTYEGFGMPILEGQAVGRAVITSGLGSMAEVAGAAACLVDPYDVASIRDGLLRVIGDPVYRADLTLRGFENVKRFDSVEIARKYFDVYRSVLRYPHES